MNLPRIILFHVDVVNDEYISGWCINRLMPNRPVRLSFLMNGKLIGEVRCDNLRDDVKQAGLHTSGRCGFNFRFPEPLDLQSDQVFTVKVHVSSSASLY